MDAERKRLSFGGGLLIYITVMITLIIVGLAVWWHYLSCYEAARYEGVMDTYMQIRLEDELTEEIYAYAAATATGYQTEAEICHVLTQALGSECWSYGRCENGDEPMPTYTLYCNGTPVGEVVLRAGEADSINMGFPVWEVPDAVFDFAQFGETITVVVPYGCTVYFSGEAISDDAVAETIGLYPQLAEFETIITEPNQLLVYRVGEVYSTVAVEYDENHIALPSVEGVHYAIPTCEDHMAEQLIEYCKGFIRAYVEYTANASSLWALQQYLVADGDLYHEITQSSSGLNWGDGVNAVVETVEIKNFVFYGNVITCDASYTMTRDDGDRSELMNILLVNTDIGWRVIYINVG